MERKAASEIVVRMHVTTTDVVDEQEDDTKSNGMAVL